MRLLIVDHYYPEFARRWYVDHPDLEIASYEDQRNSISEALFGGTGFEVAALRELGHEAAVVITNVEAAQRAWARERGVRVPGSRRTAVRMRRGLVPWPHRVTDQSWISTILLAQISEYRPDVVHVQCMDSIDTRIVPKIAKLVPLVTGQIAAPLPLERATAGYRLIVSSLPNFVERFRRAGLDAEYLPLAFEPRVVEWLRPGFRHVESSFVGSLMASHSDRHRLLRRIAELVPLDVWTPDRSMLEPGSPLAKRLHNPVWGRDMFEVLGSSKITINSHIDVAGQFANNLRLYEATGMGALLITDEKANLGELFDVGRELITYRSADDCAEKIAFYLRNPDRARDIAEAGQRRTLRDHTWKDRMQRLVVLAERRL